MERSTRETKTSKPSSGPDKNGIYFDKLNYLLLIAGILLIAIGYLMMIGGGSDDPNIFNPEIFSKRRITYAPVTSLIGFAVIIVAIMRRPKQDTEA